MYIKGFKDGIPIGIGYLSVSFTFGMMAVNMGIPVYMSVLISMTNLTSAGQFAGIGLILAGSTYLEMALTQLIINLRYALMSLSISQKVDKSFNNLHRLIISFGITDEIFAVAASQENELNIKYMYGLITAPYFGWTFGTLIGGVASTILPESIRLALGIAIYGMFIAIIIPPAKKSRSILMVILISITLSYLLRFTPILNKLSNGFVIIICGIVASILGAIIFPIKEGE